METARIDRGVPGVDHAAEIRVGAELIALLGARDDVRFDLRAGGRRLPRSEWSVSADVNGKPVRPASQCARSTTSPESCTCE